MQRRVAVQVNPSVAGDIHHVLPSLALGEDPGKATTLRMSTTGSERFANTDRLRGRISKTALVVNSHGFVNGATFGELESLGDRFC